MIACQRVVPPGAWSSGVTLRCDSAGFNAAADLLGVPLEAYQQKNYVTCLDLGPSDAVFTRGWDSQVELSGDKAKALKREINTQWIYPPPPNRADAFKASDWARLVDY